MQSNEKIRIIESSKLYETEPEGVSEQENFYNSVVFIETQLEPLQLLDFLKSIEKKMGRDFDQIRWGPRIIDLDILLYEDLIFKTEDLIIPHPLLHKRRFVLEPLEEISPDWIHPVLEKSVKKLFCELNQDEKYSVQAEEK